MASGYGLGFEPVRGLEPILEGHFSCVLGNGFGLLGAERHIKPRVLAYRGPLVWICTSQASKRTKKTKTLRESRASWSIPDMPTPLAHQDAQKHPATEDHGVLSLSD
ncbi:Hypothetical protein [Corynebacterium glutamicum ATCC 13032]|uniref:Uncharacterized protein n=1 Tax=Corynebacterium glutamicum (strain ATCC 13032 / DSM 20300 / JCM 1318 / BCRC 11384 / CCUG 27702 / LMG 3730 / NBRC 12168 / NCIMB 10025 / NRRL B-2784 / 534) TaxID=196627 RepID=Q8NQV6_CORGL|nr:Hypothetical protein [Corynebacterium glutamicum ATCC 13032]